MKLLGILVLLFGLQACEAVSFSPKKRDLDASGQIEGTTITCSGYKTWADCDAYAIKACPKGYEIFYKEENMVMQARTLRISCK